MTYWQVILHTALVSLRISSSSQLMRTIFLIDSGRQAQKVSAWLQNLKLKGGFGPVNQAVLDNAHRTFESERVNDPQTLDTIKAFYHEVGYILEPHSAVGVTATLRFMRRTEPDVPHISLSTATNFILIISSLFCSFFDIHIARGTKNRHPGVRHVI